MSKQIGVFTYHIVLFRKEEVEWEKSWRVITRVEKNETKNKRNKIEVIGLDKEIMERKIHMGKYSFDENVK